MADLTAELYEEANELFDGYMFYGNDLIDVYNDYPTDEARDMLYEIVGEMVSVAETAAYDAMNRVVLANKDRFISMLEEARTDDELED